MMEIGHFRSVVVALACMVAGSCSNQPAATGDKEPSTAQLDVVSGQGQTGRPGEQLPNAVVVRARDANGNTLAGQIVNFRVTSGGGTTFAGTSLTNASGLAQEYWTLGPNPGANALEVRAVDSGSGQKLVFATFTATAQNPAVSSVSVTPSSLSFSSAGATGQLTATARDQFGSPIAASFTWTTLNAGIATVNSSGLVTAQGNGTTGVVATSSGKADTAQVTVTISGGGGGGGGTHEPAGMTRIFYMDGTTTEIGSQFEYGARWTDGQHTVVVNDAGAPKGKAIEHRWFPGQGDGASGAAYWNSFGTNPGPQSEIYFRAMVKWNPGWQFHDTGTNKIWYSGFHAHTQNGAGASQLFYSYESQPYQTAWNSGPPGALVVVDQSGDGGDDGYYYGGPLMKKVMNTGVWNTIEVYMKRQSAGGVADGTIRAWINGQLVIDDTSVRFLQAGVSSLRFDGVQILPYWGGAGDTKTVSPYDWFRWGEFYISGKP